MFQGCACCSCTQAAQESGMQNCWGFNRLTQLSSSCVRLQAAAAIVLVTVAAGALEPS